MAKATPDRARDLALEQVLAPDGRVVGTPPGLDDEGMRALYRTMVVTRVFDQRMLNLQRQGRIGTYAPVSGQEAAQVGAAAALARDEWLFPTYRDYGAMYQHGMPLSRLVQFPMGMPMGGVAPPDVAVYAISISIASHLPHAVGAAWASRLLGERKAFLALHGDGATSEGDFHEAMNFAGVFQAPVVFVCQNNGWAISVPRHRQTASRTLAQKADAYGVAGAMVDGNDVLAVYRVVAEALERARRGEGATLVEAVTYRLGPHTTADDPTRYRSREELERMESLDPLVRMRRFLVARGAWDDREEARLAEEAREEVARAVQEAEAEPPPAPDFFFDAVFARPTPNLERQRREFRPEEGE
jgi:pyruvate dehydrogenase E1 component alpha subunit